jgi:peptide/nickel transport system substrate-binding protein
MSLPHHDSTEQSVVPTKEKPMFGRVRQRSLIALTMVAVLAVAGCGRSADDKKPAAEMQVTTDAGTTESGPIVWAVYRDVQTVDPIYAFDYPDNTAVTLMCESLLKMEPDGTIAPGLATMSRPDPTTMAFDINPDATFWNGKPVLAEYVVSCLDLLPYPVLGVFYAALFCRGAATTATGDRQVTIKLKQPDYWLDGELASLPGMVVEKAYAEEKGADYGTPSGGAMCTGAYQFKSWKSATGVVAAANPHYWDGDTPKASQITLKGASDDSALTSSLETGEISGSYAFALSTLPQLEKSSEVDVYQGPGYSTDAFIVSNLDGTLGDARVRQALSLALDRQGIADSVYHGAALLPRWFSNPGTFGYATSTFESAHEEDPEFARDVAKAKKLVQEAGAEGQKVTIGMSSAIANISAVASAYQTAGKEIGLDVELKSVSAETYINFFIDPKARAGVDGFMTVNYGDYADPAALLATFVLPDGSQNYSGFKDAQINSWMEEARGEADPEARAKLMIKVERRVNELLPWIPNVQPNSVLILNKELTGSVSSFSYMFAPWANSLGGR